MASPRVAAIVLNYNGRDITLGAIESVLAMSYDNFDVIHVDNGSSDGSFAAVWARFPTVVQVRTETNLGVAGGYNLGMKYAMDHGYRYLLILNNDIEVHPHLLRELVTVAESRPDVGCVGPKCYYFDDRRQIWSAGGILRFKESVNRERGSGERDRGQFDRDEEMGYVNGCGMLISAPAITAAGVWDPIFHMSVEDADWCVRIRRKGFRIYYAHRANLYHMVSRSTGVYTPRRTYQTGRSTAIFVRRYASRWQWCSFIGFSLLALPAAFVREALRTNGDPAAVFEKYRGFVAGLRAPLKAPPMLADVVLPGT